MSPKYTNDFIGQLLRCELTPLVTCTASASLSKPSLDQATAALLVVGK